MTDPINTFKTLDDIFDVEATPIAPIVPIENSQLPAVVSDTTDFPSVDELMDDYQASRQTLRNLLEKSEHTLENMLQIAIQTESARSFEVAGNLMKTMSEVAKDLINLHELTNKAKGKSSDDKKAPAQQVNNTQNNNIVFQGNTTDLFNLIGK